MILSASRRTDIPNYFSEWFFNRLEDGYLLVSNPMNANQVSRINLDPTVVDCIVFWTKDPRNMMKSLHKLDRYKYYFQFTITGYGKDVEPHIANKASEIIPAFKQLSATIGREKVIWRYDPILLSEKYNIDWHMRTFDIMARSLMGYTDKVIISFVNMYAKTMRNTMGLGIRSRSDNEMRRLAGSLFETARSCGMTLETCSEVIDLSDMGIAHGKCIDKKLIERIIGSKLMVQKDNYQRHECGCAESIDIGAYNTCRNCCKYCYADFSIPTVNRNCVQYDPHSPLLCRALRDNDIVTERPMRSLKDNQIAFWD